MMSNFFAGGSRHPSDLARPVAAQAALRTRHAAELATFERPKRAGDTSKAPRQRKKVKRMESLGPTPERLAKGDISARTAGGFYRVVPTIERLRDQTKLDHDGRINQAMFQAAERLKRHHDGQMLGVQAQDLNKIGGRGASDDLTQEERWVEHRRQYITARKLMGWSEVHPNRGSACIVVAVVCEGLTVSDAASAHLNPARAEVMKATAMDRLREGLFALAIHWREI